MSGADCAVVIEAVLVGRVQPFTRSGTYSAIAKLPVAGVLQVGERGLEGDEQGDLRVHGGPDKAIHHYPRDHYPAWQAELGPHPLLDQPGGFGENLSSHGLTESLVCLGDRFRLGSAMVEVSQLRQPCWKLSDRFGVADMARRVQDSGRTGWYYRVLEPGLVTRGDRLALVERPHRDWPLARIAGVLYRRDVDAATIEAVLGLPLVPSWRALFERRLAQRQVEDWSGRLEGRRDG